MKLNLETVLATLDKVKKTKTGWTACCPAHPDRNPSLSVREDEGKLLAYCHAGCTYEEIIQAVKSEYEMIEVDNFHPQIATARKTSSIYDYVDESGNLLYQAVKYEPKSFSFRQPEQNGEWIWSLKDARRVPYRLPELIQAKENALPIFICEGEKDVDNLRAFGLTATTTASGSNGWNSDDYANYFVGANVIVLPDNDDPGQRYADEIANSLTGIAYSVKIINLPDLIEKGDVSDWIQNGGNKDELESLVVNAVEWQPKVKQMHKPDSTDFFIVKLARDVIKESKGKPIPKMLFGELWFENEISILFADSNVGKSILAVQIADSITKGNPIGNFKIGIEAQKVLYFDFELTDRQFSLRYSDQNADKIINEYDFSENFSRAEINPDGDFGKVKFEDALFENLELFLSESDIKIVIIDNLTYLKSETEQAKDASALMKNLKSVKNKFDLSVLVLAHTPKRDSSKEISINDLAGSKMLMNFCDSAFSIGRSFTDDKVRYIKQIKERNTEKVYGSNNVVVCKISKNENFLSFQMIGYGAEREFLFSKNSRNVDDEIETANSLSNQGYTQRAIADEMSLSVGKVNGLLKQSVNCKETDVQPVQPVHTFGNLNEMNILKEGEEMPME